ncbi:aromatic acid exporter family protein [Clostridium sp.]|uniref:aromatic acid exporter family protein n=1 Tax=Clostridium sp. TaxID=1506 RepID=UPI003F37B0A3
MGYIYNLAFKMALSATVSYIIAESINLKYATVAAVIAILSIQDNRKKALVVGKNRALACILGLGISTIIYKLMGSNAFSFGIFLIIFIPVTSKYKIEVGMVPAVVLSTHLLVADFINSGWIINELFIMVIGIGIASIANIFMPSMQDEFNKDKEYIEETFRIIILKMSKSLVTHTVDIDEQKYIIDLEKRLKESKDRVYKIVNNNFYKSNSYYTDYINMRINQFDTIKRMRLHFEKFYMSFEQTTLMAKFAENVAKSIAETNDCIDLSNEVMVLKSEFKKMQLPKTREEFENRAQLLQFLNDLEEFISIKRNFAINYLEK